MINIRKFWFENANGDKYELNNYNAKIFLYQPQGLGFIKQLNITRLGNEGDILSNVADFPVPTGELLFYNKSLTSKYEEYANFIQFAKIKPLKFYQQTPNTFESWYIDCEIVSLEKSEVDYRDNTLHVPIQIQGLSFWKTAEEHDLVVEDIEQGGKVYPYTYPYTYEGNSYGRIAVNNNGTLDTGFKFEINDLITNPVLSLFQNDVKYGEIRINGTYDVIKVDTRDKQHSIYLEYQGSAIANPTSKFDLTGNGQYATPFPKLKVGNNILVFAFGSIFTKAVHIKWQDVALTI